MAPAGARTGPGGYLSALLASAPRILIVGTGDSGLMKVAPRVRELCRENGIKIEALPTSAAVQRDPTRPWKKTPQSPPAFT